MRVEIGPISQSSAVAWIDYAAGALTDLRRAPDASLPSGALDAFGELLVEWRAVATRSRSFRWVGDESPERVEFLIKALMSAGLVIERESERHRARLRPHAADEFHLVLVACVLRALEHEAPSNAQFVAALRSEWGVAKRT